MLHGSVASPRNPLAHFAKGQLLRATGRCGEAIPLEEQAIRLSPRNSDIGLWYFRIGQAHLVQSRIDEAIPWFEKARNANPAFPLYHAELAATYALKADTERASTELAEARRLSGDNRYSSIVRLQASGFFAVPTIRLLFEPFFAGLRKAGMPEE